MSTLITLASLVIILGGCKENTLTLKEGLAQKIMLDLRYFCPEASVEEAAEEGFGCTQPVTKLPKELAQLITDTSLGGVILFAENIDTVAQTVTLTRDLQNAALSSTAGQPLFISTDQEGGRVVRIPRAIGTSFAGNMAIGATYAKHGDKYARAVGKILGSELKALGINVDHGPDVDVNVNPENPVINVRSFSENPQTVADLGIAMLEGIESVGVMATLKHFPGHGDTNTDSHTGLPKVMHNLVLANQVDLYPFKQAIDKTNVQMIMTAHIQYPALDNSEIVNKLGQSMIKPATLSKKILTDLLRNEMGYQGLIITDALDMAGISHFFTPMEAVLTTFEAGADIAMMPIKMRTQGDIERFKTFLKNLTTKVAAEPLLLAEIEQSVIRIITAKQAFASDSVSDEQLVIDIDEAEKIVGNDEHRVIELALAEHAIVEINKSADLTDIQHKFKSIHVVFPEPEQSDAFVNYLVTYANEGFADTVISQSSLHYYDERELFLALNKSDLVIVASDSQKTAVELGGVEDLNSKTHVVLAQTAATKVKLDYGTKALRILKQAKAQGKTTIFVTLKLPSKLTTYRLYSDWLLATFDANTHVDSVSHKNVSPSLSVLADVLLGNKQATGVLPITL